LTRSKGFYSIERHVITPLYIVAAYLRPKRRPKVPSFALR